MTVTAPTILIMAAGTGGHVFPALSIADCLRRRTAKVEWLATRRGLENELLADSDYPLHRISVSGLRGSSLTRKLLAPLMLLVAFWQSLRVLGRVRPDCVLGMGGFVSGPAGVASRLLGIPLLIHEQNAVAGLSNRLLARLATRIFEAFPGVFPAADKVRHTGNPLRADIAALHRRPVSPTGEAALRVLVLGGSRGAAALNQVVPGALTGWRGRRRPEVLHQTGAAGLEAAREAWRPLSASVRVQAFIKDMAAAYGWADLVICRSGASTVSELAAAGLASILVPYPWHRDRQQLLNAAWLVDAGAALLLPQDKLSAAAMLELLERLDRDRDCLHRLAGQARRLAICDADQRIADECLEVARARS